MKFKKFGDIENVTRAKFTAYILAHGLGGGTWRVSEKIHGANMSLWYDGTKMRVGKRSGFIPEGDNSFYNAEKVREENTKSVIALFKHLKSEVMPTLNHITIYGEIFGGFYPHKDVEKIKDVFKVQKGVYYSPDNLFYAFDLVLHDSSLSDNPIYMNDNAAEKLFKIAKIFHAIPLFEGTLNECVAYSNEFESTIPGLLGLPELEKNVCEGIVIRPNDARFLPSGSRVILKSKNAKFSETGGKHKTPKELPKLSDAGQKLFDEMKDMITENRIRNILSKLGPIGEKEFGKLLGAFMKDVVAEMQKDHAEAYYALEDGERKLIHKFLNAIWASVIRPNFLNIIDGEF